MLRHSVLLQVDIHTFVVKEAAKKAVEVTLDGFALSIYEGLADGVTSFLSKTSVSKWFRQKKWFYRSDVLRQAVTLLRINDYLVSGGRRTPRNTIGVGEMILALQRLFRQWELHLALYKHIAWKKPELQKRVPDEEIDAPKPQLSEKETLMVAIICESEPEEVLNLPDLRLKFRHRSITSSKVAEDLHNALDGLIAAGLLVATEKPEEVKKDHTRYSRKKGFFKKVSLSQMGESEARQKLNINARHFPA